MSDLDSQVAALAEQLADDVHTLDTRLGDPAGLQTRDRSSLVAAVNELKAAQQSDDPGEHACLWAETQW